MFHFVAMAVLPLRVDELADSISRGINSEFRGDWREKDPVHAVLLTCPSVLAVVD